VPCFTAARTSTEIHRADTGPEPVDFKVWGRAAVLLDRLKQVGQVWGVLDLSEELVQLRVLVWKLR
jgi:hypothetical protein